jgi:O-antigen/teichoic acid export membrane protein
MSTLQSLLRNTGYLMLGEATKPLLSLMLVLVVARMLGTEGMGAYSIILTFAGLMETVAAAGLSPVIVRGVAANRAQLSKFVSGALGTAVVASAIVVPVLLLLLPLLHYPPVVERGIQVLTVTLILALLQGDVVAVCEGLQMMKLRTVISLLDTGGRTLVGLLLVVAGYGVEGLVFAMVAGRALTTVTGLMVLRRQAGLTLDIRGALPQSVAMLRAGLPFLMITLLSTVNAAINTLLLSGMKSVGDVGLYNAAVRLPDLLRTVVYCYMIALLPVMSQSFTESLETVKRQCDASVKYLALITVPISTGLAVLAPRFLALAFGDEFAAAAPVLQLLAWNVAIFSVSLVFARALVASGNEIYDLASNIACVVLNVSLGWLLIPRFGPLGAGISSVASLLAFGACERWFVSRLLFKPDMFVPLARVAASALAMTLVLRVAAPLPLLLLPPLGAVVYFVVLFLLGTFTREEIEIARRLSAAWLNRIPLVARRTVAVETEP